MSAPGCRREHKQAQVLLCLKDLPRLLTEVRRDDHLQEDRGESIRSRLVNRSIDRDDAAERGNRIGGESGLKCSNGSFTDRKAARNSVLDYDACRLRQALDRSDCRVRVEEVVVRESLALELLRAEYAVGALDALGRM